MKIYYLFIGYVHIKLLKCISVLKRKIKIITTLRSLDWPSDAVEPQIHGHNGISDFADGAAKRCYGISKKRGGDDPLGIVHCFH